MYAALAFIYARTTPRTSSPVQCSHFQRPPQRIVPQMQVHMRTYEDAKRVARGLFEGASAYHTLQEEHSLLSITPYVLKAWQILADVVPLHAS